MTVGILAANIDLSGDSQEYLRMPTAYGVAPKGPSVSDHQYRNMVDGGEGRQSGW